MIEWFCARALLANGKTVQAIPVYEGVSRVCKI